jgi:hypothetical protein
MLTNMKLQSVKMLRDLSRTLLVGAVSLFVIGCDHETEPFDGPSLINRFGEFMLIDSLESSPMSVDFSQGETVSFSASFNKEVEWILTLRGIETGAVKRIEGFSNFLSMENALWEGRTTELPFFGTEQVAVELLIASADSLRLRDTIEVLGLRDYEATVFTDFEQNLGGSATLGNFEFELTNRTGRRNDTVAAQGDWFYYFEGTDDVVPNFFVGLVDIRSTVTGQTYAPVPTTVPEELFFNAFLLTDGGPHGIAVIQFIFDSNDNGTYEDGMDQVFQLPGDFPLSGTGWQHIHHPMSEVGMSEEQLQKIVAIRLLLISDMNSQPMPPLQVDYGIDFLAFTSGGPLEL